MSAWREEIIGDARLICADCREVLPTLGKVDAVVTDPPFGIVKNFGVQKRLDGHRRLSFEWDSNIINDVVFAAFRMLAQITPSFFTFCGASQISHLEALLSGDFTVKPAVWIKACPPPAMPGNWWPSGFAFALYGYQSGAWFGDVSTNRSNVFYSDTYRHGIRSDEKVDHPTQLWLPLAEKIVVSICPLDGVVLDPFMGSGTTGVACARLGRRFIGIEVEPRYFEIACKRIEDAQRQGRLFDEPARRAEQLDLIA